MFPAILLFIYTVVLSLFVFDQNVWVRAGLIVFHSILAIASGIKPKKIRKFFRRFTGFLILILISSAVFTQASDPFTRFTVLYWTLGVSWMGIWLGITAATGVLAVVSVAVLFESPVFSLAFDRLALRYTFFAPVRIALKYVMHTRPHEHTKTLPGKKERLPAIDRIFRSAGDLKNYIDAGQLAVSERMLLITALSVILASLKAVRLLPGIPFAPGQRLMVILPVLFYASYYGRGFAATMTAWTYGLVSLFLGSVGQLGVFEIVRIVILGFCIDLFCPTLPRRAWLRFLWLIAISGLAGGIFGIVSILIPIVFRVPGEILFLAAPRILTNIIFGAVSGTLTAGLLTRPPSLVLWNRLPYNDGRAKKKRNY